MAQSFANFDAFAQAVLSLRDADPSRVRLDGEQTGGSRDAWAYFQHRGRNWKVDADTHLLPIIVAYQHYTRTGNDPFQLDSTPTRDSLVVIPEVQAELVIHDDKYQQNKYLYIYAPREDS